MIPNYSDHAANERTFLAWVRTGIATIAFGFVIERLEFLARSMTNASQVASQDTLKQAFRSLGHYDGPVLVCVGVALIALAALRFARTGRLIESDEKHVGQSVRTELVLSITLIMAALAAYVSFDSI